MQNLELVKLSKKGIDLQKLMMSFKNFNKLQKEIKQDEVFAGL